MSDDSELQLLRSRYASSLLKERRWIERALHDGLQQDLIAISVQLQLMRDLVATSPAEALTALEEVRDEVRAALDRLRMLAAEIYPAVLDARGLPDALRLAVRASGAEGYVEVAGLGRYPAEVEAAVFFLWRTVLDGVGSVGEAVIRMREEGTALRVEIAAGREIDLAEARDLVEGARGVMTVESEPAAARVEVTFPLVPYPPAAR